MIDRLEILIALARERHFGRAAEVLGITQPSLSAGLKALERQLGVQLVRRGARYEGLTPEGERALDWARRIVAEARAFRADMRVMREGITGELRLGVIPTAAACVAPLTARFLSRNPQALLAISSLSSDAIVDGIDALELDAALTYLDTAPPRLLRRPLYDERYLLVERNERAGAASWEEAAARPLALLSRDMRNRAVIDRHLAATGADGTAPRISSSSTLALIGFVAAGGWATILPAALVEGLPLPPGVTARSLPGAAERIGLVAREREPQPPIVAALLATLPEVSLSLLA